MSETMGQNFNTPAQPDFDTMTFSGSMQQVLQDNIGKYVIVEFFMGTDSLAMREGYLYYVAAQYIVLFDEINLHYVVCDMFSIKFVTFLLPNYRPGQVPVILEALENANREQNQGNASSATTMSRAAFSFATKNRRPQS